MRPNRMTPGGFSIFTAYMRFLTDVALSMCVFVSAYYIRFEVVDRNVPDPERGGYVLIAFIFTGLNIYFTNNFDLFRVHRGAHWLDEVFGVVKSTTISLLLLLAITFFYREISYSRLTVGYAFLIAWVYLGVGRIVANTIDRRLLAAGHGVKRVLLIGTGGSFLQLLRKIKEHPEMGYSIMGYVEEEPLGQLPPVTLLGSLADLDNIIHSERIDLVFITLKSTHHGEVERIVDVCDRLGVECKLSPDLVELIIGPRFFDNICGVPLITVKGLRIHGINSALKRAVDFLFSLMALIVLSPILFLISVIIRIDSPGPIFYMQKRVGLDGIVFYMIKFRSMRTDAEASGPAWSRKQEDRTTRIGGWLRKLSIDEVPQLFNVIRGEMSLVGPRPERPFFVEQFEKDIPRYLERHKVKSGMTGWAQVNGLRGDTSIEERIQYDLYYIENWSVWFDFKIIIMTVLDILNEALKAFHLKK